MRTTATNLGSETYYNDFDFEEVKLSTEDRLSELEGTATPLLDRLREDPGELLAFTNQDAMHFARFLAAFRFRVPAFRAQVPALQIQLIGAAKRVAGGYLRNQYRTIRPRRNRSGRPGSSHRTSGG